MTNKWIKIPGPGQMRGEGNWYLCGTKSSLDNYEYCKRTGYMPTYEGERPPKDDVNETQTDKAEVGMSAMWIKHG